MEKEINEILKGLNLKFGNIIKKRKNEEIYQIILLYKEIEYPCDEKDTFDENIIKFVKILIELKG